MLTLNFKTPEEMRDEIDDGVEMVFLETVEFFGMSGINAKQEEIRVFWEQYSKETDDPTGGSDFYDHSTESHIPFGAKKDDPDDQDHYWVLVYEVGDIDSRNEEKQFMMTSESYFLAIESANED